MIGLLTLIFCLFFWRLLFEQGVAVPKGGGDFNSFYYPLSAFAAGQVQAGHFPLWNPYLYAGAPFAADYQAGALYPPNLLVWAVARPFTYGAFEALAIFHIWWASVTAYGFRADDRPAARAVARRRHHLRVWRFHDGATRPRTDDRGRVVAPRHLRRALSRAAGQHRLVGRRRARA